MSTRKAFTAVSDSKGRDSFTGNLESSGRDLKTLLQFSNVC